MRSATELDAERAVLGSILIGPERIREVRIVLAPADFSRPKYAAIYAAMMASDDAGDPIDIIAVRRSLETSGTSSKEAFAALAEVVDCVPASANAAYYARIVSDAAAREVVMHAGARIVAATQAGQGMEETLGAAEKSIADVWASMPNGHVTEIGKCLGEAVSEIAERRDTGKGAGISTGFIDLDRKLGGLRPGEMTVIAGRPGMGKTSLALAIAAHAAQTGIGTLLFSMESDRHRAAMTIACAGAKLSLHDLERGSFGEEEFARLMAEGEKIRGWPLWICDRANLTLDRLWGIAQAHVASGKVGLVVVDYLQLMDGGCRGNRQEEVSALSRGLKRLAMSLSLPVVALSSLNRGTEQERDKRPRLANLRESGAIEQDADAVLLLYRDEEYDPESKDKGVCEVGIAKNRTGPCGVVKLAYAKVWMRFDDL